MELLVIYGFTLAAVLILWHFQQKEVDAIVAARPARPVIVTSLTTAQLSNALEIKRAMDAKTRAKMQAINAKNLECGI